MPTYNKYIAYYSDFAFHKTESFSLEKNRHAVLQAIGPEGVLLSEYREIIDRQKKEFPILERAILHAKNTQATLIFTQLQPLVGYELFARALIHSDLAFTALDLPNVDKTNLTGVVNYARKRTESHRRRVLDGLHSTMAKLGNPNALHEITKINKPKIENAIIFALVLSPIIEQYKNQQYSQRKMVQLLNDKGFFAPEGGTWVLSQLQKVLERIRLNDIALNLMFILKQYKAQGMSDSEILKALNHVELNAPSKGAWSQEDLHTLNERINILEEIIEFNEFVLDILPEIEQYYAENKSNEQIAKLFNEQKLIIPKRVIWEREYADHLSLAKKPAWDPRFVELAEALAVKRKEIIDHLNLDTFLQSYRYLNMQIQQNPLISAYL